eukprot:11581681-Ditylum_brightwellii.AAC.1
MVNVVKAQYEKSHPEGKEVGVKKDNNIMEMKVSGLYLIIAACAGGACGATGCGAPGYISGGGGCFGGGGGGDGGGDSRGVFSS